MLEWIETPKRAHLVLEIANMGNLSEYIKRVRAGVGRPLSSLDLLFSVCFSRNALLIAPQKISFFSGDWCVCCVWVGRIDQLPHILRINKLRNWSRS